MTEREIVQSLRDRAYKNLTDCIMAFWASDFLLDEENGGFVGLVTLDMEKKPEEPRALVLFGRMVFAFAKSYILTKNPVYLDRAKRGFYYLVDNFYDKEYGGAYNQISYKGEPLNTNKLTYGEPFFILACAAYYEASGDPLAKKLGLETFHLMETKCKTGKAVYVGGWNRDWTEPADMFAGRGRRMMPEGAINFQHHLCQSYEHLYRATKDPEVFEALHDMAEFIPTMLHDTKYHCFKSTMDKDGNRIGTNQSFGHDAEISYLAMDIAELTGDEKLVADTKAAVLDVLDTLLERDFDEYGGLINGGDLEDLEASRVGSRVWWAEAEAGSALMCGYYLTRDRKFLDAEVRMLDYIEKYFVNKEHGDWYNNILVDAEGGHVVDGMHGFDKVNGGKCPFHNTHMCLEIVRRCDLILAEAE